LAYLIDDFVLVHLLKYVSGRQIFWFLSQILHIQNSGFLSTESGGFGFYWFGDRKESYDFYLFTLLSLFLRGKRKGEKNNQSRGQKSFLSAQPDSDS
jgi:hypothetical protein